MVALRSTIYAIVLTCLSFPCVLGKQGRQGSSGNTMGVAVEFDGRDGQITQRLKQNQSHNGTNRNGTIIANLNRHVGFLKREPTEHPPFVEINGDGEVGTLLSRRVSHSKSRRTKGSGWQDELAKFKAQAHEDLDDLNEEGNEIATDLLDEVVTGTSTAVDQAKAELSVVCAQEVERLKALATQSLTLLSEDAELALLQIAEEVAALVAEIKADLHHLSGDITDDVVAEVKKCWMKKESVCPHDTCIWNASRQYLKCSVTQAFKNAQTEKIKEFISQCWSEGHEVVQSANASIHHLVIMGKNNATMLYHEANHSVQVVKDHYVTLVADLAPDVNDTLTSALSNGMDDIHGLATGYTETILNNVEASAAQLEAEVDQDQEVISETVSNSQGTLDNAENGAN